MTIEKYNEINKLSTVIIDNDKIILTSVYNFKNQSEKQDFINLYILQNNTKIY